MRCTTSTKTNVSRLLGLPYWKSVVSHTTKVNHHLNEIPCARNINLRDSTSETAWRRWNIVSTNHLVEPMRALRRICLFSTLRIMYIDIHKVNHKVAVPESQRQLRVQFVLVSVEMAAIRRSFPILLLSSFLAKGTELYVTPSGSGDGTMTSPFGSIQLAVNKAVAGDTIYLRAGTYNPTTNIQITKSGTLTSPITLRSYQKENVIIDGEALPGYDSPHEL